jgi:hypothetical protein
MMMLIFNKFNHKALKVFMIFLDSSFPVVLCTGTNCKQSFLSLITSASRYFIQRENCSTLLTSVVSSAIITKNLDFFILLQMLVWIW